MNVLLDASVCIAAERGRLALADRVVRRADEWALLSVVTASELLHGVHRASAPGVRARRAAFVEGLLTRFPVVDIDLTAARAHARLGADLAAAGTPIGPHDLWLAAQAVAHGHAIATANVREFRRVPGLVVEDWAEAG